MTVGSRLCFGLVKRHPLRLILISLCAMICFTGCLGLNWAADTITGSRQAFETACGKTDLVVYTEKVNPGALRSTFGSIPGVFSVNEGALAEPVRCTTETGSVCSARFFTFAENPSVILSGDGAALSYGYIQSFTNIEKLILPDGRELKLDATAAMPMYTGVYVDRFTPCTDGDIVDVYVSPDQFEDLLGSSFVNYATVILDGTQAADDVLKSITSNDSVFVSYAAPQEPAFKASMELETVVLQICRLFSWILLFTGLLFIFIFLSGIAGRCKASIIRLLADGASSFTAFWAIFLYGIIAMSLGFLCAVPCSVALSNFIATTTLGNMGVPIGELSTSPIYALISIGFGVFLCALASAIGIMWTRGHQISALRRKHSMHLFDSFSTVLPASVSIMVSMIMVLMSSMFMDSLDGVRAEQFTDRYAYDVQIIYDDFVPLSELQKLKQTDMTISCEPMLVGTMTLKNGDKKLDVTCVGLSDNPLLTLRDKQGTPVKITGNDIILSSHAAEFLGVHEDELIQADIYYGDISLTATASVSSITEQSTNYTEAISIHTVEQYLNSSGVMNSVAIKLNPGTLDAFCTYARSLDNVYAVQTGEAAQKQFDNSYAGTRTLIWLIIAIAIALGLSVCLLMCYAQWKQQIRKNTILHILGKSGAAIALQNGLKRVLGTAFGLAAGILISRHFMPDLLSVLSTDTIHYPLVTETSTLLAATGLCICFELCCQIFYIICCIRYWHSDPSRKI